MSMSYAQLHDQIEGISGPSAAALVPHLLELAPVTSVVDIGCGRGWFLAEFLQHGVQDIYGIDSDVVSASQLHIPPDCFEARDLSEPFELDRRFDLAMSLEVAEHLPESSAASFVECLVALAPLVVFSAAVPGQRGLHHVNEQWPRYWIQLFARHGYQCRDVIRPAIWNDGRIAWWYRQNLLVFESSGSEASGTEQVLDLVHPELFSLLRRDLDASELGKQPLRRLVKALPVAAKKAVARRLQ